MNKSASSRARACERRVRGTTLPDPLALEEVGISPAQGWDLDERMPCTPMRGRREAQEIDWCRRA